MCTAAWRASAILSCLFSEERLLFSRQTQIKVRNSRKSRSKDISPFPSIIMGPPRCRSRRLLPERTEDFGRFVSLSWHGIYGCVTTVEKLENKRETIKLNLRRGSIIHPGRVFCTDTGVLRRVRIVLRYLLGSRRAWKTTREKNEEKQ